MAKTKEVKFDLMSEADEVIRQFALEVEVGKKFKERALELAQVEADSAKKEWVRINIDSMPQVQTGKYKFTFGFEIYEKGVLKKNVDISAINDTEDAALESVVEALKDDLSDTESYRYTNVFKKEEVK